MRPRGGAGDRTAKLWDATTGALIQTFSGHRGGLSSVAFSPDGTKVLTGSADRQAWLWDATTGAVIRKFIGHTLDVSSVAFSPDGTKILTGSMDRTAKLWDVATGAEIRTFSGDSSLIHRAAFSLDGTQVLTSGDGRAKLWDVATGAEIMTLAFFGVQRSAAFSPDGSKIVTGVTFDDVYSVFVPADASNWHGAVLWDAETAAVVRTFVHCSGPDCSTLDHATTVAFSPDGTKVLKGNYDGTAQLWDAATGAELQTFGVPSQGFFVVTSVAFSPDGTKVLTGHSDGPNDYPYGVAKLWDVATGAAIRTFGRYPGPVTSVAFSPDGTQVLTGSGRGGSALDRNARLWDVTSGALIFSLSHGDAVSSVAFSPDGTKILTGSWDWIARLWDARTGVVIRMFLGHTDRVLSVAFSPDGAEVLTASGDRTVKLWDTATGTETQTFTHSARAIDYAAFAPDGTKALTIVEATSNLPPISSLWVWLWDIEPAGTDLTLTQTASPPAVTLGSSLTYTLSAINQGPDAATGVVVTDTLPAGVTFVSAEPSQGNCMGASIVICTIGELPNGGHATVTIVVTPLQAARITNVASVGGSELDPDGSNNSAIFSTTVKPPQHTLTVSKAGTGTGSVTSSPAGIDCGTTCSADFDSGTSVTLTATPATGSTFGGWSGACSGTSSCTVTMTAAKSVTATFTLQQYTLTVSKGGTGRGRVTSNPAGLDCGADCKERYARGTVVELTADPAADSVFTGWAGACRGTGVCVVWMTANRSVKATFKRNRR